MYLKRERPDDWCVAERDSSRTNQEAEMFQDSLSEGHLYFGRAIAIIAAATFLAYFAAQL